MQIIQDFIAPGRKNRPGYFMSPEYITIHNTGNASPGADAKVHASYIKSDACANRPASWHFSVDDKSIYQHLPLNENGWHCGDGTNGTGNRKSIGIEICMHKEIDQAQADENAAWLTAKLLKDFNLTIDRVVQHNHWTGKNCPSVIRARPNGWENWLEQVKGYLGGTPLIGTPQATKEQAKAFFVNQAAGRNVKLSPQKVDALIGLYWKYGALTGLRPEVLFVQSMHETGYLVYGGNVVPEQNNFAGIKIKNPVADNRDDHQWFETMEDGVRAHFNHICAYAGLDPIGVPHDRYWVVKSLSWAGTVKTVEGLSGKYAPSSSYGQAVLRHLDILMATEVPIPSEPTPSPPNPNDDEESPIVLPDPPEQPTEPPIAPDLMTQLLDLLRKLFDLLKKLFKEV